MNIISYNLNGIRAAMNKGLLDWLKAANPDVFLIQEAKANEDQVDWTGFAELGYQQHLFSAEKKGYSGVALLSKKAPDRIVSGMGLDAYDKEGRVLRADYGDLTIVTAYFPSGSSGDERQDFKMKFLADFLPWARALKKERPKLVIAGDVNICHLDIDIHNPKANQNTSGFLPEERAWVSEFLNEGFEDSFRLFHPEPHQYTWWSYRAASRARNKGWRIDYQFVSEALVPQVQQARILSQAVHSDHCPTQLILDWK